MKATRVLDENKHLKATRVLAALVGTEFSRIGEGTPKDANLSYLRYGLWFIITVCTALFWRLHSACGHRKLFVTTGMLVTTSQPGARAGHSKNSCGSR